MPIVTVFLMFVSIWVSDCLIILTNPYILIGNSIVTPQTKPCHPLFLLGLMNKPSPGTSECPLHTGVKVVVCCEQLWLRYWFMSHEAVCNVIMLHPLVISLGVGVVLVLIYIPLSLVPTTPNMGRRWKHGSVMTMLMDSVPCVIALLFLFLPFAFMWAFGCFPFYLSIDLIVAIQANLDTCERCRRHACFQSLTTRKKHPP